MSSGFIVMFWGGVGLLLFIWDPINGEHYHRGRHSRHRAKGAKLVDCVCVVEVVGAVGIEIASLQNKSCTVNVLVPPPTFNCC